MPLSIMTPKEKTYVSFQRAIEHFVRGRKILVECRDSQGNCYAAHLFSEQYGHTVQDLASQPEYTSKGSWYVLDETA